MLQRNNHLNAQSAVNLAMVGLRSPALSRFRDSPCRGGGAKGKLMSVETIIIWLIVGAIAGWLAGMVVKGTGYGLIGDIIVGIIGAVIAGWLLPRLGIYIGGGFIAAIIDAFIGAVILLIILRLVRR